MAAVLHQTVIDQGSQQAVDGGTLQLGCTRQVGHAQSFALMVLQSFEYQQAALQGTRPSLILWFYGLGSVHA